VLHINFYVRPRTAKIEIFKNSLEGGVWILSQNDGPEPAPSQSPKISIFDNKLVSQPCTQNYVLWYTCVVTLHYYYVAVICLTVHILVLQKAQKSGLSGDYQNRPLGKASHCAKGIAMRCTVYMIAHHK
jgi:hypothetical protein